MYTTKEYDEKVEEYPVEVGLGQPLFLEGRVESGDKDLLVFLEMCKATLTSNHNDKPDHMIIENSYVTLMMLVTSALKCYHCIIGRRSIEFMRISYPRKSRFSSFSHTAWSIFYNVKVSRVQHF